MPGSIKEQINKQYIEQKIKQYIKHSLESKNYKVFTNVCLGRFKERSQRRKPQPWPLNKWFSSWPTFLALGQPDIDILFLRVDEKKVRAAEIKFFNMESDYSFYEGIDEALAYLLFGFDFVSLWHYFYQDFPEDRLRAYATRARRLIVKLKLPISYRCSRVFLRNQEIEKEKPKYSFLYDGGKNPLSNDPKAKEIISFIRKAYRIPDPL